MESMLKR